MKSTLSWEDSKCKGPGAGVMIEGERGDSPECQAEPSAGRGVQIEAGEVHKALARRVYDFILKAGGLENNHLPHLTTEGPFRQTKAPS